MPGEISASSLRKVANPVQTAKLEPIGNLAMYLIDHVIFHLKDGILYL
jgi:hypothetical protein